MYLYEKSTQDAFSLVFESAEDVQVVIDELVDFKKNIESGLLGNPSYALSILSSGVTADEEAVYRSALRSEIKN